jgi:hypothetical protein
MHQSIGIRRLHNPSNPESSMHLHMEPVPSDFLPRHIRDNEHPTSNSRQSKHNPAQEPYKPEFQPSVQLQVQAELKNKPKH